MTKAPASPLPPDPLTDPVDPPGGWIILALAVACGVTVANLYYAQPLIGPISESFGMGIAAAGLLVTTLQLGYVAGLIFLVPLGDLVENKTLILVTLGTIIISLTLIILAPRADVFIAASLLLGFTTTATQMIVPMVAHLSPDRSRGQIVGTVMSGLLIGILLARPVATLIAGAFGWRAVYIASIGAMGLVMLLIAWVLPRRTPTPSMRYRNLIVSLWNLLLATPALQLRATYHALLFAAFSVFWSAVPLLLQATPFSLGSVGLSLFLMSGLAGAFVAPFTGRLADRGWTQLITGVSIATVAVSFVLTWFGGQGSGGSLAALVAAGILLDAGVQGNLVAGQRIIYAMPADIRSRLTALYLAIFFFGGAVGSSLSGFAVAWAGASAVAAVGLMFVAVAASIFAINFFRQRQVDA